MYSKENKKKKRLIWLIFSTCFISFLVYKIMQPYENHYFIEDINLHIKTRTYWGNKDAFVYFYNADTPFDSKSNDYLHINKAYSALLLFNPHEDGVIYFINNNNFEEKKENKFKIIEIAEDSMDIYFEEQILTKPQIIKSPYFEISIHIPGSFYIKRVGEIYFSRLP